MSVRATMMRTRLMIPTTLQLSLYLRYVRVIEDRIIYISVHWVYTRRWVLSNVDEENITAVPVKKEVSTYWELLYRRTFFSSNLETT